MIDFNRNNLDKSISPYLQQHKDNPIYWQEWSKEVLNYAEKQKKILFVSVGYATCHWCHVMAAKAFSNQEVADYLNENFVSIKVDREQRPDIDNYLMSFLVETQGQGGWPLNAFLQPNLKPMLAVTYVPLILQYGMMPFIDILRFVKDSYDKADYSPIRYMPRLKINESIEERDVIKTIKNNFDKTYGAFGHGMKFPPHNTLLFLLSYFEKTKDHDVKKIIEVTLHQMATRGLHDHLQGGFYRYCTDEEWKIPHFEKMLYDQAMLLWIYSIAYHILKKDEYRIIAEKIIKCLCETFEDNGMFYSAHDADTDNHEGLTYVWTEKELKEILGNDFDRFVEIYEISEYGNFEGKNHLIKKKNEFLKGIENRLLEIRKKRKQPFADKKIITSWNALTGIGLLMASRYIENNEAKIKAKKLFERLLKKHYLNGRLCHSSLGDNLQMQEFLEDYASLLLFAILLYQEDFEGREIIEDLFKKLKGFYPEDKWLESKNIDFIEVPAQTFDHPVPSSASLAEFASLLANMILEKKYGPEEYSAPLERDFFNLMVFIKNGNWHEIHTPEKIDWKELPFNSIQLHSQKIQYCHNKKCLELENIKSLMGNITPNGRMEQP